jgi:hypothetical protein
MVWRNRKKISQNQRLLLLTVLPLNYFMGFGLGDCKRAPDAGGGVLRVLGVQHEVQAAGERQATYHHRPQERETTYLPQV